MRKSCLSTNVCSRGMILNDTLECETVEKKDEIVAIANSIAVDASMKPAKLNSDQMVLSEYFAHICSGDKSEVVYWPKGGQLKTHYINHKNGELLVVNNTMKKFPSTTYCVDEAKHEGELSYALMMCPCTVSTCIQKCCPETMHFDTIIEQCVPSNPNISTFQPTLQRMMNDTQNEHFFLTYGIPQCKGQLMMLLLNMTKVYPQESGYLMLDDEENGQHQFYERGKYCLDIFSSQAAFAPKLGGFICRDGFTNYTYQEVSDKNLLEVVPFSVYAPRKIERLEEATEDKESADSTEFKGAEYKTEDVDRGIEVVIKSFDSRSAAVQTAVFWEMVVVLVFVLLCKK
ncbi:unnamed protein product [Acanthoscelides obtectus]|uniref:Methuselah N-terminal domain-containing protein n=1 Tax=Acanthoscelides obtectus TaxID=200917 RepID=A0A9P0KKI9_ACAOB|nr:unnamed protein product [Acanthoscelides obtectus]CAK1656663.1 hypothetical protein AOBTE_LOCUS19854 [Acanthoscelides obtectus]